MTGLDAQEQQFTQVLPKQMSIGVRLLKRRQAVGHLGVLSGPGVVQRGHPNQGLIVRQLPLVSGVATPQFGGQPRVPLTLLLQEGMHPHQHQETRPIEPDHLPHVGQALRDDARHPKQAGPRHQPPEGALKDARPRWARLPCRLN